MSVLGWIGTIAYSILCVVFFVVVFELIGGGTRFDR
jgi:hypothetical protein